VTNTNFCKAGAGAVFDLLLQLCEKEFMENGCADAHPMDA